MRTNQRPIGAQIRDRRLSTEDIDQTEGVAGAGFSPEVLMQVQQMLNTILEPILQRMLSDQFSRPSPNTEGEPTASEPSSSSASSPIKPKTASSYETNRAQAGNTEAGPSYEETKAQSADATSESKSYAKPKPDSDRSYQTREVSNDSGQGNAGGSRSYNTASSNQPQSLDETPEASDDQKISDDLPVGETISTDTDYRTMSKEERRESSGMSDRERAVLHLWGIQMTSKGSQDGGVLMNVAENPNQFQDAEVALAEELRAKDEADFGGVTGRSLDDEFFNLYENMTGNDIRDRYDGAPLQFADGPVDMDARLSGDNGLNDFENQVLQLWGHAPLFNQGQIDGNILDYALNSQNTLEANLNRADLESLKAADLASDGVLNGDSLENAFVDTLDRLYLGGPSASSEKTMNDALQEAALRREGVLPAAEPSTSPTDDVRALAPTDRAPGSGGGSCPFLASAA